MTRLTVFTTLYPSSRRPRLGIFVEQRLRRLIESGGIAADAVVPVPRCPPFDWFLRQYREQRKAPAAEVRFGVPVCYPRFPTWPLVGRWLNPLLMALGTGRAVSRALRAAPQSSIIDAHFFYPDGVAAVLLGAWFRRSVVITARGSDVNVLARSRVARAWMRWAAKRCAAVIAVSQALADAIVGIGVEPGKVRVLRNGVDLAVFGGHERSQARRELALAGTVLLSVGNLIEEKGHQHVLRSLVDFPDAQLVIVGEGPREAGLRKLADDLGVSARVRWISVLTQAELARYYAAADVTVLMSANEGLPNVLIESMACGTPVVATNVGGVSEVVTVPESGLMVDEQTSTALSAALRSLLSRPPDPARTRAYAARFDWRPTTDALKALYRDAALLRSGRSPGAAGT